ncbi:MAG: serine/threonine-protein kinase [Myxococcota bacterium]
MPDGRSARPELLERIGRYRIVRPLSRGGMALVYEARREGVEGVAPRVAIKIILPEHQKSETFRELFINEARLGASMQHQNLVQIQDFSHDEDEDQYFLVMEYVEGVTVRKVLAHTERTGMPVPLRFVAEVGRQACDGLHFAHMATDDRGQPLQLVHRDIKPSNLILSDQGLVKVLDFGISKGVLRSERRGSIRGTWGYMSPEQATGGAVGPLADVFGLAVVLYELAARQPLFPEADKATIRDQLEADWAARHAATLDPATFGPLVDVLIKALQRDPADRFASAAHFGRALSRMLPDPVTARDEVTRMVRQIRQTEGGLPPGTRPIVQPPPPRRPLPPRKTEPLPSSLRHGLVPLLASMVVSFVVLAALSLFVIRFRPVPEPMAEGTPPQPGELRGAQADPPLVLPMGPPPVEPVEEPKPVVPPPELQEDAVAVLDDEAGQGDTGEGPAVAPPPPPTGKGLVLLDARQPAEVYVDGVYVSSVPFREMMAAGPHTIMLVAADGRRRTFKIDVLPDKRLKRVWDFERMEWRR